MTPEARKRARSLRHGRWAEGAAKLWLRLRGWRILAQRHPGKRGTGIGEVDLVIGRGHVVAFVEIKFRPTLEQAASAISTHQQRRVVKAASAFVAAHPGLAHRTLRFDAVLVAPYRLPVHLANAWGA